EPARLRAQPVQLRRRVGQLGPEALAVAADERRRQLLDRLVVERRRPRVRRQARLAQRRGGQLGPRLRSPPAALLAAGQLAGLDQGQAQQLGPFRVAVRRPDQEKEVALEADARRREAAAHAEGRLAAGRGVHLEQVGAELVVRRLLVAERG